MTTTRRTLRPSVDHLEGRELLSTFTPVGDTDRRSITVSLVAPGIVGQHIGVSAASIQGNHIGTSFAPAYLNPQPLPPGVAPKM